MASYDFILSSLIAMLEFLVLRENLGPPNLEPTPVCETPVCRTTAQSLKSAMDDSVDPCHNFIEFSCGNWMKINEIPKGRSRISQFENRKKVVNLHIQEILSAPPSVQDSNPLTLAKLFYKDCINTENMSSRGLTPLLKTINEFGGWPLLGSWKESSYNLTNVLHLARGLLSHGRLTLGRRQGALFGAFPASELDGVRPKAILLAPPSFYVDSDLLKNQDENEEKIQKYKQFIKDVVQELGENSVDFEEEALDSSIDSMIEFEAELADAVSEVNPHLMQQSPVTIQEFQETFFSNESMNPWAQIDWQSLLEQTFGNRVPLSPDYQLVLLQPNYFDSLQAILSETPLETLANYFMWRIVSTLLSETTDRMREIQTRFQVETLEDATEEDFSRAKVCSEVGGDKNARYYFWAYALMPEYIQKYFDPQEKEYISRMVNHTRSAFLQFIASSTWLTTESKATVTHWVEQMGDSVAYPDWVTNSSELEEFYSGLKFEDGHHFENHMHFQNWQLDKELEKLSIPASQIKTDLSPLNVQAHYDGSKNMMVFTTGVAGPPFFHSHAVPSPLNFATIGHVIGHELVHSLFVTLEQHVTLTEEESEAKSGMEKCVSTQYLNFSLSSLVFQNGSHWTLEEDVADLGGIQVAYLAHQQWWDEGETYLQTLPGLEAFSLDQLFYIAMAQMWCENVNESELQKIVLREAHSPGIFRILGPLMNSPDFARAWSCPPDSSMNPSNKCSIW